MQTQAAGTVFAGLLGFLETKQGVTNVEVIEARPATASQIALWEKFNGSVLPEELKQFYLTNDGFTLQWSYLYNDEVLQLGRININGLSQLQRLGISETSLSHTKSSRSKPSLLDLDYDTNTSTWRPSFGSCKIFSLDYCSTCGHTCLVYNTENQGFSEHSVWLLDLSLSWHLLSTSFSDYLRLASVHLGLKQWPYALTTIGLSPIYEKWFHMFIPKRLDVDLSTVSSPTHSVAKSADLPTTCAFNVDVSKLLVTKSTRDKRAKGETKHHKQHKVGSSSK